MKLQVNAKGAWRDVCTFEVGHTTIVQDAAWRIALCAPDTAWRMTPKLGDPLYLDRKARTWKTLYERRGIEE